ncbi:hypothetical protein E2562_025357, partial [Oryza meyeriana var. granulata]
PSPLALPAPPLAFPPAPLAVPGAAASSRQSRRLLPLRRARVLPSLSAAAPRSPLLPPPASPRSFLRRSPPSSVKIADMPQKKTSPEGTVVDHVGSATWILTSATLVRKRDNDYDAYQGGDVKIEVLLHNKRIIEGCLAMCSLQYNIAVVTIEPQFDLPLVKLHDLPGCYSMLCRPVISVARNFKSKTLLVRCGEMTRECSKLDCNELLVCTCPVSKVFIGGLVMYFERRILGITFYDKDAIPFLPTEIAVRCLEHYKNFRTLKQPSVCIRGQAIHKLEIRNLEKICYMYPELSSGIVVKKISEVLPENCGSIEAGDVICSIDDVVLYSVAQRKMATAVKEAKFCHLGFKYFKGHLGMASK